VDWNVGSGGYLYYQRPVTMGATASPVTIEYTGFSEVTHKKVILAVESIRASYSADDTPYADWNVAVSSNS